MKKIILKNCGAPEVLQIDSAETVNAPKQGEVGIQVHYSGINFADIMMRIGLYPDAPPLPFVPGYEVSGIVSAIGTGVTNLRVGDRVAAGTAFGGYASEIVVDAHLVFKIPQTLTLAEAAALPVNWITAYAAIQDMGRVRKGDRVLVDSATGGVGTIALQILRYLGTTTVGLTSSPDKLAYIESYGAQAMTQVQFENGAERDFDLILNSQGGSTVRMHYERLKPTGRIVVFGVSSAVKNGKKSLIEMLRLFFTMPRFSMLAMFDKNHGVYGLNALHLLADAGYRQSLQYKWQSIESMGLKPHIGHIFPAEKIAEAHTFLQSRKARGKVLISWSASQIDAVTVPL